MNLFIAGVGNVELFKNVVNSTFSETAKNLGACFDHIVKVSKNGILWMNEAQAAGKLAGK